MRPIATTGGLGGSFQTSQQISGSAHVVTREMFQNQSQYAVGSISFPLCNESVAPSSSPLTGLAGAGGGTWLTPESTYTADGRHMTSATQSTTIPTCLGSFKTYLNTARN